MDAETIWTTADLGKFIWQRVKLLCEAEGFVSSPRQSKYMVRIGDHHIQIVRPKSIRGRTILCFGASSAASFRTIILGEAKIYLRRDNNLDDFFNEYHMLALDPNDAKLLFDGGRMQEVWEEIVAPQLEEELFSVLRPFGFEEFSALCENRKNGVLRYSSEPGIDDGTLNLSKALIRIWQGRTKESIPLLEQALSGYERHFARCEMFGEKVLQEIQEESTAARKLLSAVKNGAGVLERAEELEKTALNKVWGIGRSPEGAAVRLKRKEWI